MRNVLKSYGLSSTERIDISCVWEKILDCQGYNGKVPLICQQTQATNLGEEKSDNLNASHKICGGSFLYETFITEPHPWLLCVHRSIEIGLK